jgi:hypothetical protein
MPEPMVDDRFACLRICKRQSTVFDHYPTWETCTQALIREANSNREHPKPDLPGALRWAAEPLQDVEDVRAVQAPPGGRRVPARSVPVGRSDACGPEVRDA